MKNIGYNVFHIIIVASLLCSLAKNLKDGNDILKIGTYSTVFLMVSWHAYLIYKKLSMPLVNDSK